MAQEWAEELHGRIAAAIKAARGSRPAQWLADETERLGYPVSRSAIANYESGRKKGLDIAELLVIAAALRIPPVTLLFPQLPDGVVDILPGTETTSWEAAAWFSGEEGSPRPDDHPWPTTRESELVRAVRDRRDKLFSAAQLLQLVRQFALEKNEMRNQAPVLHMEMGIFAEQARAIGKELNRLEQLIRESGGVLNVETEVEATERRRQLARMQREAQKAERSTRPSPEPSAGGDESV